MRWRARGNSGVSPQNFERNSLRVSFSGMGLSGAILLLTFPMAALADLNETTILQTNSALNLDTGAVAASGGDILWNGSTLAPQGSAKARNLGEIGSASFGL